MARVWTAARSEPAVGSDRAIAPIHLPLAERRSSASRRASSIGCVPSHWARAKILPTQTQKAGFERPEPHTAMLGWNGNAEPALRGHLVDKTPWHLRLLGDRARPQLEARHPGQTCGPQSAVRHVQRFAR